MVPSLELALSDRPGRVRLIAADDRFIADLRQLGSKYPRSQQPTLGTLEIELDDLLINLPALAAWPEPDTVVWEPALASLVQDVVADSEAASAQLSPGQTPSETTIDAESIQGLLDPTWIGALTAFQRRDIARVLSLRHGADFSVPGAGKTRVGLAVFSATRASHEADRLLIVGPKSSYEAWRTENVECFNPPLALHIYDGNIDPSADAVAINYERLQSALPQLLEWLQQFPCLVILDEAHRMKRGTEGVYGSACLTLAPFARRRLILTGTPAPNGARDLESLFAFVWPGHGRQVVTRAVAGGNLAQASAALRPLFTRTTKHELEIPDPITRQRPVRLPPVHREIYDALVGQYSARAATAATDFQQLGRIVVYLLMAATTPALLSVGTTRYDPLAYQVPPLVPPRGSDLDTLMRDLPSYEMSPKYKEAVAIVAQNAAQGRKTLVWSTFIRSINTLADLLREYSPAVVHGGTVDRESEIARFRHPDSGCFVLLSNPATLGEGISLHHECHDAVYVDRDFAAGKYLQSLDRIHRLGLPADAETRITVLVSERTIDEVVSQRLQSKLDFMGQILDDPAVRLLADLDDEPSIGGGIDDVDLQAIIGYLHGDPS
ncbi:DEAD/DEAH box helicase [Gordonia rhizosphera]|nr:DEAD/DEAH box helicase [Gordonia rhizosphera]